MISNAHRLGTLLLAAVAVTAAGATAQHGTARGLSASAGRPGWRHVTTYRWDKELRQFGDGWDHGRRSWWRFVVPDKSTTVVGNFAVTRRGTLFVNSVDPIEFGVVASFSCLDASGNGLWSVGGALEENVYPTVWLMGEQAYLEYDGKVRAVSESNPLVPRKPSACFEATYHGFVGFDPAGAQVCVTQASLQIYSPKGALLSSYPFPKNAPPEDVWLRWESARNVFLSRTGRAFLVDASSRKGMHIWNLVRSGNGQGH